MQKAIYNWSGGKDSSFALWEVLEEGNIDIQYLLTSLSSEHKRISMHGVPEYLLEQQAENIGLPLRKVFIKEDSSLEEYNKTMTKEMNYAKSKGIDSSIFGDIFLEDLRKYREEQLKSVGLKGIFPIWKRDTLELVREFVDAGFKAVIVSANARLLDKSFCGRVIDHDLIDSLPFGVDPCGENGEFHSFVFDGPIFSNPIKVNIGETIMKKYKVSEGIDSEFWYCDLK
ncbi:MAG: diphthine--ammonia ligase [Flavobacteriales bacterium]|nr:diphthine--ammonia ligase [Flavobacteriales bacterium]